MRRSRRMVYLQNAAEDGGLIDVMYCSELKNCQAISQTYFFKIDPATPADRLKMDAQLLEQANNMRGKLILKLILRGEFLWR